MAETSNAGGVLPDVRCLPDTPASLLGIVCVLVSLSISEDFRDF